jgi:aminopeptidase-like protein
MTSGQAIYDLVESLYPICRSITGDGVRQSLALLQNHVPLQVHEVPSGTPAFDWVVPLEWNIREAYVEAPDGERLVDFTEHNLHVVGYSVPVDQVVTDEDLTKRLHSLPDRPDWIPYRTSYYSEDWGFCVRHRDLSRFRADEYRVRIDASLQPGSLSYGELLIPGRTKKEFLFYSHICHPSLCNDNLSGIAVTMQLAKALSSTSNRYSYRFVWAPGTIGSITWLSLNQDTAKRVEHGLVAALLGDRGPFHYKRSRRGNAEIDRFASCAIESRGGRVLSFEPYGYDERQFCSPAFDLPMGRITRSPNGAYAEYHTSADDLNFVSAQSLGESYALLLEIVDAVEHDRRYVNLVPFCEPQLGKRGLYRKEGGTTLPERELALLWMLSLSDGANSLLDVAERSRLPFRTLRRASDDLVEAELLAVRGDEGDE